MASGAPQRRERRHGVEYLNGNGGPSIPGYGGHSDAGSTSSRRRYANHAKHPDDRSTTTSSSGFSGSYHQSQSAHIRATHPALDSPPPSLTSDESSHNLSWDSPPEAPFTSPRFYGDHDRQGFRGGAGPQIRNPDEYTHDSRYKPAYVTSPQLSGPRSPTIISPLSGKKQQFPLEPYIRDEPSPQLTPRRAPLPQRREQSRPKYVDYSDYLSSDEGAAPPQAPSVSSSSTRGRSHHSHKRPVSRSHSRPADAYRYESEPSEPEKPEIRAYSRARSRSRPRNSVRYHSVSARHRPSSPQPQASRQRSRSRPRRGTSPSRSNYGEEGSVGTQALSKRSRPKARGERERKAREEEKKSAELKAQMKAVQLSVTEMKSDPYFSEAFAGNHRLVELMARTDLS